MKSLPNHLIIKSLANLYQIITKSSSNHYYSSATHQAAAWVHAGCGTWGTLAVGLFHPTHGLLHGGGWRQLGIQLIGAVAVLGMSFVSMAVVSGAGAEFALASAGNARERASEKNRDARREMDMV